MIQPGVDNADQARATVTVRLAQVDPSDAGKTACTTIGSVAPEARPSAQSRAQPRRLSSKGGPTEDSGCDYELHEIIGKGGMGVVYVARQTALGRMVALKRLRRDDDRGQGRERFLAEAAVTGRLDHPNIVPIHDVGVDEQGLPFYTMKRVSGRPWSQVLRTLSEAENLDVLLRVADAVAFAHDHGVVHRDLKPDNVMLGAYGEVLLADWGLAGDIAEIQRSLNRCAAGTPAYMAPEMAWGEARLIGPRSDIYLLGAILYEILVGEAPHPGSTVQQSIEAAAANRIEPPIPRGELGSVVARALEMQPEDRFATVQEFQQAVRECRTHAESARLVHQGNDLLARARVEVGYRSYTRALYAFEEALVLWPENSLALTGAQTARMESVSRAIDAGDLDLAESLLDPAEASHAPLLRRLADEQQTRRRARRRITMLSRLSITLGVLVLVVLGVSLSVVGAQYRQVVRASHERDDAEARLLHEESQRQLQDRRTWNAAHSEDFSDATQALPLLLAPSDWLIADGVLSAVQDGAQLNLPSASNQDMRVQFDLVTDGTLSVYLGVPGKALRSDLRAAAWRIEIGTRCRAVVGGREVANEAMPPEVPGLFRRLRIEKDGHVLRVLVNSHELIRCHVEDVPPVADPHVVIRALHGTELDNLRLDHLR
jgi:predicted Ser/Thr protein kinase